MPATYRHADCPSLIEQRSNIIQSESGNQHDCLWLAGMDLALCIPVARILWDFDFLRGVAPGRLDGFSIGRYEKNRESFDLNAVKFESGAMRFWGKNRPNAGTLSK